MNNGMKPIQRYEMVTFENWSRDNEHLDSYTEHQPSDNGDWVKWEDVEKLFMRIKIHLYTTQLELEKIRYNANNGFDLIDDLNTKMGWDKLPSPREMYELRKQYEQEYEQGEEE
jgi:hypothetical protein